ncbi:hypothetical protein RJ639_047449 [Escallonia herrerae]|uniref:Uncharacterized protein n=1 Tax=Escallonia herrerae TaxID=1293975 RepID=A0AA89B0H6_9ASTE|nr:hypothetical protein RJ639_047449 [Escallonia herrerae]
MSFLYRFLPLPVVRGVQLSQGLSFSFTAIKYVRYNQDFASGKSGPSRPFLGLDGVVLALACIVFLILSTGSGDADSFNDDQSQQIVQFDRSRRRIRRRLKILSSIPSSLIVFLLGLVLCFVRDPSIVSSLKLGPSKINVLKITWEDWKIGFVRAAIPQIPLSVLNSVIAVCKLSADLFPDKEVSATAVSISVGVMNFVGCWFGAMPVCHGAGGWRGSTDFEGSNYPNQPRDICKYERYVEVGRELSSVPLLASKFLDGNY